MSQRLPAPSSTRDMADLIAMIGCYSKWEWGSSRKKTKAALHRECKQKLLAHTNNLLRVDTYTWMSLKRHLMKIDLTRSDFNTKVEGDRNLGGGTLTIVADSVTPAPRKAHFEVDGTGH